jgi:PAS domain-containing protein
MFIVVSFDTLFFSILVFWNDEKLQTIITSGLISKGFFALFYSILFYFYIKYFDFSDKELVYIKIKDVFKPLSYKQKFESAVSEIIKVEEERKLELINSNKEKEKRIEELKDSQEKIKTSLELLAKKEYSISEASKIVKIGFFEEDIATETRIWSDYLYHIFGHELKDQVPTREEIAALMDEESQQRMWKSILDLDLKGIPFDVEAKITNLRNEELWLRIVAQPIYNHQNKIVGRRGVLQDITEQKIIKEQNLRITENYKKLFDNATFSIWNEDLSLVFEQIQELKKHNIPNIKI